MKSVLSNRQATLYKYISEKDIQVAVNIIDSLPLFELIRDIFFKLIILVLAILWFLSDLNFVSNRLEYSKVIILRHVKRTLFVLNLRKNK